MESKGCNQDSCSLILSNINRNILESKVVWKREEQKEMTRNNRTTLEFRELRRVCFTREYMY